MCTVRNAHGACDNDHSNQTTPTASDSTHSEHSNHKQLAAGSEENWITSVTSLQYTDLIASGTLHFLQVHCTFFTVLFDLVKKKSIYIYIFVVGFWSFFINALVLTSFLWLYLLAW